MSKDILKHSSCVSFQEMGLEVFILYLTVFTFFSIVGNNFIRKKVLWILSKS